MVYYIHITPWSAATAARLMRERTMFRSYVVSAFRALQADPWHATINIAGLAVALTAGLLVALYVRHEFSYEDFITNADRVFRVEASVTPADRPAIDFVMSPYPLAEALRTDLGEQTVVTRLSERDAVLETSRGKIRRQIAVGDERMFDVLDYPVVAGDAAAAMAQPGALLLSVSAARELFGGEIDSQAVLGRSLRVDGADMHVAAILADPLANTDHPLDIVGSVATTALDAPSWQVDAWGFTAFETFIRLNGATQAEAIAEQLPGVVARHKPSRFTFEMALRLRPLREMHLVESATPLVRNQNVIALAALAATGAFLIFIACFSYINLATARSLLRLKEVGLRKIMGGRSSQLALQFLAESALITLIAFALAIVASAAALPAFGNVVGRTFSLTDLARPDFLTSAVGLLAFVTLAAGGYPALVLARRKPVDLVRAKRSSGGKLLRTGIVSLQFGLTSALMIAAAIAFAQLNHLRSLDLGFDKEGLLIIPMAADQTADGRDQVLRDRLAESPSFTGAAWSSGAPGSSYGDNIPVARPGDAPGAPRSLFDLPVSEQFFDVYGMELLAGRAFSEDLGVDHLAFPSSDQPAVRSNLILSESALPRLGFRSAQDAVGEELIAELPNGRIDYTVIGVVSDMLFRLGRAEREPTMFLFASDDAGFTGEITARVRSGAEESAIAEARAIWSELFPDEVLNYEFLDDRVARINAADHRQSQLFIFFAMLALFVSCLGLFALASFVAARRAFEVAVRKVLGASSIGVTRLLMWDFAKPVLLANIVAWPLAYVMVRPWLARFPYRIELSPIYFLAVSAAALAVAMATVFARSWKTARTRPAVVLRTE